MNPSILTEIVILVVTTGVNIRLLAQTVIEERNILQQEYLCMIQNVQNTQDRQLQQTWAELIEYHFKRENAKQIDAIVTATQTNDILRNRFVSYFEAVELNSAKASEMKASYLQMQEWANRRQETPLLDSLPKEKVILALEKLESGNLWAWSELNMNLTLKPDSRYYDNELDLTKLPGWEEADIETRKRIVDGAYKYILEQDQVAYEWIGTNTFPPNRFALTGCRALLLLLKESPKLLDTIPLTIWQRWAPVIIGYPSNNRPEDYYLDLVKLAYVKAHKETINTLFLLIDKENEKYSYISITDKFKKCWDENLKSVLLEKAKDKALKPEVHKQLIEELLKHGCNEAKDFAKSMILIDEDIWTLQSYQNIYISNIITFCLLPPALYLYGLISYLSSVVKEYQRALFVTKVLIENSDPTSWSLIWSVVQQDTDFGREVFEMVAYRYSHGIDLNITEKQIADFYIWLVQQYPHNEDPVFQNAHHVGTRESIGTFRDSVLAQLKETGTPQACVEIQRIAKELPELTWLKKTLLNAQNITRRKTWKPPTPASIFKLITNTEKRLVQDSNELLDILLESLQKLQLSLQGQTPAVIDLWNEIKLGQIRHLANSLVKYLKQKSEVDKSAKIDVWEGVTWKKIADNTYIPKDENRFSDYVVRYLKNNLEEKGVVVNREVEIRRGERTDIQVDAIKKNQNGDVYDSVTVIIEAKGCWNSDLDTAMEKQLVNRYLKDNTCQHGIYLIGWFNCEQWDNSDSRKNKAPKTNIYEARKKFEKQAEQLSQSGVQVKAFILNTALR